MPGRLEISVREEMCSIVIKNHFLVINCCEDFDDLGLTAVYAVPITCERCYCAAIILSRILTLDAGISLYVSLS